MISGPNSMQLLRSHLLGLFVRVQFCRCHNIHIIDRISCSCRLWTRSPSWKFQHLTACEFVIQVQVFPLSVQVQVFPLSIQVQSSPLSDVTGQQETIHHPVEETNYVDHCLEDTLCVFISTNVVDFDTINVTTCFRKLFQVPSTRVDKENW
jgi:hypothetical protein